MERMVSGGAASNWICINFSSQVQDNLAGAFFQELAQMCNISGMGVNLEPVLSLVSALPEQVEKILKTHYLDATAKLSQGRKIDLIFAILPDNNESLYGDMKRICETKLGVACLCCLTKHVFKMSIQYMANLAMRINVKIGERTTVLVDSLSRRTPLVTDHDITKTLREVSQDSARAFFEKHGVGCWDTRIFKKLESQFLQLEKKKKKKRLPMGARPSPKFEELKTFLHGIQDQSISKEDVKNYMGTAVYQKLAGEESDSVNCYSETEKNFLLRWTSSKRAAVTLLEKLINFKWGKSVVGPVRNQFSHRKSLVLFVNSTL